MGFISTNPIPNPVTPHAPTYSDFMRYDPQGITFGSPTYFTSRQAFWKITYKERKILRQASGMYWTDMRKIWWAAMISNARDPGLLNEIVLLIHRYGVVPVRSGRLLDKMIQSMHIRRYSYYRTHFWVMFSFLWTLFRPYPIGGRVGHSSEIGYGELYYPVNNIPNRTLLAITGGGNGKYLLDDSWALNNPVNEVRNLANDILFEDIFEIFNNMVLIYIT